MIKKVLSFVFFTFLLSFVLFTLIYYTNSNAVYANKTLLFSKSYIKAEEVKLGLNDGLISQYFAFLNNLKNGNVYSLVSGKNIFDLIRERVFNSIVLIFASGFLMLFLGIFLGLVCALKNNKITDKIISFFSMFSFCIPSFYMGLLLILIFSIKLDMFPSSLSNDIYNPSFLGFLHHLFLPLVCLVLSGLGIFVKFSKDTILIYLNRPYIKACFLNGFKKKRVYFFVIYDCFSTIFGYFSANFIAFLSSSYIIEKIFSYSGIGELFINSLLQKDYPLSIVLIVFSFFLVSFFNFLAVLLERIIFAKKEVL